MATLDGVEKVADHMEKNVRVRSLVKKATRRMAPAESSQKEGKRKAEGSAKVLAVVPLEPSVESLVVSPQEDTELRMRRPPPQPPTGMPPALKEGPALE